MEWISRQERRWVAVEVAVVFLLCASLTTAIWRSMRTDAKQLAEARFSFKVREAGAAIKQRLRVYENALLGASGLFAINGNINRVAWRTYVQSLRVEENYPGIQGIGYAARVPAEEKDDVVADVRRQGFAHFDIWPAGRREGYSVVLYLEPFDWRNQRAFGYDMWSEPRRQKALRQSCESGLPNISDKVTLVQETSQGRQPGFLMFVPVYTVGMTAEIPEERCRQLLGWVYSPFRMNNLMAGILGGALSDIRLHIYDGDVPERNNQLYVSDDTSGIRHVSAFSASQLLDMNGHHWLIQFDSLPTFESNAESQKPTLVLTGGLIISLLFSATVGAFTLSWRRSMQLRQSNHELLIAKDMAESANRAKSRFLAAMSHELRTPLNAVLGYAQILLREDSLNEHQSRAILTIQRSGQQLLILINDILDLSKVEAGKLELKVAPLLLGPFLEEIVDIMRLRAEKKGLQFLWVREREIPKSVTTDEHRLRQVLFNLLSNSIKFTDQGQVIFRIKAGNTHVGDAWFLFEIEDSGIGIAPENLTRIFESFEQAGDSVHREMGAGLGLAISGQWLNMMHSELHVDSGEGKGSRFWFELQMPLADLPDNDSFRQEIKGYAGHRRYVLIADDDPVNRGILSDLLSALGFETAEAVNGEQAL